VAFECTHAHVRAHQQFVGTRGSSQLSLLVGLMA